MNVTKTPNKNGFAGNLYGAVWRWHFYAGVLVAPFFLISALTGIAMALDAPIERALYGNIMFAPPGAASATPEAQRAAVAAAYPGAEFAVYIPPADVNRAAQFIVTTGGHSQMRSDHAPPGARIVYVDPYRAEITGEVDPQRTPYAIARKIHGTLMLGDFGDRIIEIIAGFGVLLTLSGLYLWAPRGGAKFADAAAPKIERLNRNGMKALHAAMGFWLAPFLLFFFISGLAWTPVWGGQLVQAWSSFPAARLSAPSGSDTHASMDHGDHRQTPWALAQTPMPASHHHGASPIDLDAVTAIARSEGVEHYRINFPKGDDGVWTISATTISGDIRNPRNERTIHLDRNSGAVLAEVGFDEYSLAGKAMAAGVPLHQAGLGGWNIFLNVAFCLVVIAMTVTSTAMWFLRRPTGKFPLSPPPLPADRNRWFGGTAIMLGGSLLFPLTAAALIVIAVVDAILCNFSKREPAGIRGANDR